MKKIIILIALLTSFSIVKAQETYAEKLGYPKDAKVLILHVDDVGMSYDSNLGAIKAMENGVANSLSMMMTCNWIPGFFKYLALNPETDAGLHLTLTSEWDDYRWGPLSGKPTVPGLVDKEGALWPSVGEVITHASASEVEAEIRAQLERSRDLGWEPTHLDSHMGTLFADKGFLEAYLKVGMEENIPVMFPGGHNEMIAASAGSTGLTKEITDMIGNQLWEAGLPVLDDLHNISYGWTGENEELKNDKELQAYKTENYIKTIKALKPGLTMVIMHCTWPTEVFEFISESGKTRKGDLLAMMDPALQKYIADNDIILTTWREAKKRRDALN